MTMRLTRVQRRNRQRVEAGLRLASPFLDLMLALGDRVSRVGAPERRQAPPVWR